MIFQKVLFWIENKYCIDSVKSEIDNNREILVLSILYLLECLNISETDQKHTIKENVTVISFLKHLIAREVYYEELKIILSKSFFLMNKIFFENLSFC